MFIPRIPGPPPSRKRPPQFSLKVVFLVVFVACILSCLLFSTSFVSIAGRAIADLPSQTGLTDRMADEYRFFQTQQSLWVICGAATFILTVPLAVGVSRLGPNRGFYVFWLLSFASLVMFLGALICYTPRLGDGKITDVTVRTVINIFCHFPIFFVPLATGVAWYLSDLFSS